MPAGYWSDLDRGFTEIGGRIGRTSKAVHAGGWGLAKTSARMYGKAALQRGFGGSLIAAGGTFGGAAAAYAGATYMAPGPTTMGTIGAGAYFGARIGGAWGAAPHRARLARAYKGQIAAGIAQPSIVNQMARRSPAAKAGRIGGGVAGAVAGMALAGMSRTLFGPSKRANYGYR